MPRVFISCVTAEFGAYRVEIDRHLRQARYDVSIQEDFPQGIIDTIQKLDAEIKSCDVVIHILGTGAGAIASTEAVAAFLQTEDSFPGKMSKVGNFETLQISYTQWEAFLAAYHDKPLFVYQALVPIRDGHPRKGDFFHEDWPPFTPAKQDADRIRQHCKRLLRLQPARHVSEFRDKSHLIGRVFADLKQIDGAKPPRSNDDSERKLDPGLHSRILGGLALAAICVAMIAGYELWPSSQGTSSNDLEHELLTDPNNVEAINTLMERYSSNPETGRADAVLDKIIQNPDVSGETIKAIANFYGMRNNLARQEIVLDRLVVVSPDSPDAWYHLARVKAAMGKTDELRSDLRQSLELISELPATNSDAQEVLGQELKDSHFSGILEEPDFTNLTAAAITGQTSK